MTARRPRAFVVVDLGFGDSGKGLLTDFLVRRTGARWVVRYNGGAQAGHNVVAPDGRHHTFAQFGAGTFVPGVRTFLSRHVVVHPTALAVEADVLAGKGIADPLSRICVSARARVITPFHQAANRLRELARGAARHGSCGIGVGETVKDALEWPGETIHAGDLRDASALRRKLARVRERKRGELRALLGAAPADARIRRELGAFDEAAILEGWIEQVTALARLGVVIDDSAPPRWLEEGAPIVFEGAQGVLLDEGCGLHPFTTWSRCTAANALELLAEHAPEAAVERVGVLRSHAMRHGPGPLPTETNALRGAVSEPHNQDNAWQGGVRHGWFDAVLARYALDAVGGVDRLAVTHLDAVQRAAAWKLCPAYRAKLEPGDRELVEGEPVAGALSRLATFGPGQLERQARLARLLARVEPVLQGCEPSASAALAQLEALLGRTVDLTSCGPHASDVSERSSTTVV